MKDILIELFHELNNEMIETYLSKLRKDSTISILMQTFADILDYLRLE